MKKYLIGVLSIISILSSNSRAQNQIRMAPYIGIFIYNSENHLKITDNNKFSKNYGVEASYINYSLFDCIIQMDYSFTYSVDSGALEFIKTIGFDTGISNADISLSFHTIDILLKNKLCDNFCFAVGPSFSLVNRSVFYDKENFEDRLVSFNIGLCTTIDMLTPLSEDSTDWYFYGAIKLRYLYGLIFNENERDLSNYNQHFLTLNLLLGLSYSL